MKFEPVIKRLQKIFLVLGSSLGVIGVLLIGTSIYVGRDTANPVEVKAGESNCDTSDEARADCGPVQYSVTHRPQATTVVVSPQIKPSPINSESPGPDQAVSTDAVETPDPINDTLPTPTRPRRLVPPTPGPPTATITPTLNTPTDLAAADSYTSTAQVHPRIGANVDATEPETAVVAGAAETACPTDSPATYDLITVAGPPTDHPDFVHGDFNIALRDYAVVSESLELVSFYGATAPDPPQLSGLFQPNRGPAIKTGYQVNDWLWDAARCEGQIHGCAGPPLAEWEVTMIALTTNPGEAVTIPERGSEIHPGGYKALVLFAAENQITLGYTRRDSVAAGYTVHILGVCVDPNLLALYRAQNNADGWRTSGRLPALRNDQTLGTAARDEIRVAIRDRGSFLDPRSGKDWWRGY